MVITEALAEIKTLEKRIAKKEEFVRRYVVRQEIVKDPHEKDGGSANLIAAERQSIADLRKRWVDLRVAIAKTNLASTLSIEGETKSVAEWLVWRREVAAGEKKFVDAVIGGVMSAQKEAFTRQNSNERTAEECRLVVNVNELELAQRREQLEQILGTLDGALSIHNATQMLKD